MRLQEEGSLLTSTRVTEISIKKTTKVIQKNESHGCTCIEDRRFYCKPFPKKGALYDLPWPLRVFSVVTESLFFKRFSWTYVLYKLKIFFLINFSEEMFGRVEIFFRLTSELKQRKQIRNMNFRFGEILIKIKV